ncbi:MAG: translation initiation factor [Bacteroidales bacterium]|nr:translation initiation factor [Bacteroidales bacterium]
MKQKNRDGIVYSTNPDFKYRKDEVADQDTLPADRQLLYIWLESKGRKGKTVTLVKGFVGKTDDLEALAVEIKKSCGTGGSVKDREIVIQGDFRDKIVLFLSNKGYKTKKAGR